MEFVSQVSATGCPFNAPCAAEQGSRSEKPAPGKGSRCPGPPFRTNAASHVWDGPSRGLPPILPSCLPLPEPHSASP
eukprot:3559454-Pyramimonas_sp.AAC.1